MPRRKLFIKLCSLRLRARPKQAKMTSSQDFKSLQEKIQTSLVAVTRRSNQIAAEDVGFHRSSNPKVDEQLGDETERLLGLATSLLNSAAKNTDLPKVPELEDADDVDVNWTRTVDVLDNLLEKADTCLDEYTGLVKRKGAPTEEVVSTEHIAACHVGC